MSGLSTLWTRLLGVIGRGRSTTLDDSGVVQKMQVKSLSPGEVVDNVRRLAEYGFTSVPPAGSDVVVVFPGGERSNGVIIASGNQVYRLKNLADGDVALYDSRGHTIKLTATGIFVDGGSDLVQVQTAGTVDVNAAGSVLINGDTSVTISGSGLLAINTAAASFNCPVQFHAAVTDAAGHDMTGSHIHTGGTILGKTGPVTP